MRPLMRASFRPERGRRNVPDALRGVIVVVLLYLFLAGISMLETGIAGIGEGFQERVLRGVSNPVAGLSAGLLVTVLVQSSSVATAAIVGLVGAGTLPLEVAIPMVMGANVGTTVTSTLAALGSIRRSDEFRRAFAGATMHDFYNLLLLAVLFPLEVATGLLQRSATWLTGLLRSGEVSGGATSSPIREVVKWPAETLGHLLGVRPGAILPALVVLAVGLACIFVALGLITKHMRVLLSGRLEIVMNRVVTKGGGAGGIVVGLVVTLLVQSSTITTSMLVPMLAAGILSVRNAFPITLGANIGTTFTALLASLAVVRPEGLTIALVHVLYNVFGVGFVYPIRVIRRIPIRLAEGLADIAVKHASAIGIYVIGVFIVAPLLAVVLLS